MTSSLYSYQGWLNFYETKASVLPYTTKTNPILLKSELLTISQIALDRRAYELRDSDSYLNKKLKTAAAGIIPGLKSIVSVNQSEKFADEALRAFGLSDVAGLEIVARNLKRSTSGRQDLAMDVLKGLAETLGKLDFDQLLTETGIHAASETVHLKPGVGQAISAGIGYTMTRKRLLGIIEKARATAGEVHRDLLIPSVVQRVLIASSSTQSPTRPSPPSHTYSGRRRLFGDIPSVHSGVVFRHPSAAKNVLFDIFMSILALALLTCLYFYKIEMSNDELSQGQYWGFIVIAVTSLSLFRQVSAFRVMLIGHVAGSLLFWSYLSIGQSSIHGYDGLSQFAMACIVTLCGILLLRRE